MASLAPEPVIASPCTAEGAVANPALPLSVAALALRAYFPMLVVALPSGPTKTDVASAATETGAPLLPSEATIAKDGELDALVTRYNRGVDESAKYNSSVPGTTARPRGVLSLRSTEFEHCLPGLHVADAASDPLVDVNAAATVLVRPPLTRSKTRHVLSRTYVFAPETATPYTAGSAAFAPVGCQ